MHLSLLKDVRRLMDMNRWMFTSYQVLVLGFGALILIGALLLMTPWASAEGKSLPFIDALFTATSAVCVTGLVVVDTGTYFSSFGQLVVISLIQLGGLGIMSVSTLMAVIAGKKIQLRERLIMQEAMNQLELSGIVRLMLYVIKATLIIEFIGGTILALHWYPEYGLKGIYFGYWHGVSAFCNAGFDLFGEYRSVTQYVEDPVVNLTIAFLIILGGIGFTVIAELMGFRRFEHLTFHTKMVLTVTAALLAIGTAFIYVAEYHNPNTLGPLSESGKLLASFFQSVVARTAGFNSVDLTALHESTLLVMIILMFIGASPSSTGGGIKTTTFGVLVASTISFIRGKEEVDIFYRSIHQKVVQKALTLTMIASLLVLVLTLLMSFTEQASLLKILFEVTSGFATVGLSVGVSGEATVFGKLCLILSMFLGRVGTLTVLLSVTAKSARKPLQYPQAKILIG